MGTVALPQSGMGIDNYDASVEYPKELEADHQSGRVKMRFVQNQDGTASLDFETPEILGNTIDTQSAIAVRAPEGATSDSARLVGELTGPNAIDIQPPGPKEQALDEEAEWVWIISSESKGTYDLNASITIQWPGKTDNVDFPLTVEVTKPFPSSTGLELGTLLSGFIGSGLSVPFLYGVIKERKKASS